jgi:methionyl-tRNA formyltransferase
MGSPPFAVRTLEAILLSGRSVPLVVTQPDKPAGRGQKLSTSAVKEFALSKGLAIFQPTKMKDPVFLKALQETGANVFVVAAFGRILPRVLLDIPKLTLNVHASLLPKWRGAGPIERSIVNGDKVTGVSIMKLVEELDAGDVMLQKSMVIEPNETAGELEIRMAEVGAQALIEALDLLDAGKAQFAAQDATQITFAPPIDASEGKLNWTQSVQEVHNRIRGFFPWPGAYTVANGERIKIHRSLPAMQERAPSAPGTLLKSDGKLFVACSDGWIEIVELQRESRKRQPAAQFLAGYRMDPSTRWE